MVSAPAVTVGQGAVAVARHSHFKPGDLLAAAVRTSAVCVVTPPSGWTYAGSDLQISLYYWIAPDEQGVGLVAWPEWIFDRSVDWEITMYSVRRLREPEGFERLGG